MVPAVFSGKWLGESAGKLMSVVSVVVFLLLDFLDTLFCILYGILDEYFEGDASPCYCGERRRDLIHDGEGKLEGEMSETLYERKNVFREMGFLGFARKRKDSKKRGGVEVNRWSDCGCESCVSWMKNGDQKLYVIVREPSKGNLRTTHLSNSFLMFVELKFVLLVADEMEEDKATNFMFAFFWSV
jgi:hypothetical protein